MLSTTFFSVGLTFISTTQALAIPEPLQTRSKYPFNQLVAFGDEFSDNGNGSYAHGITGFPANVYGFGTWTNGPVAVSYLADMLDVPLKNFAFGGCCGGESFGATLDSAYTKSPAGSPSLVDQISNYTGNLQSKNTMGFIWAGQNDLSIHTDAFWFGDPRNAKFASDFSSKIAASVKRLLDTGARYVFVANIYPKQLAPVTKKYLCDANTQCVTAWGKIIQQANTALESSLRQFGENVIYYDVYTFLTNLLNSAPKHGFTKSLGDFCDGGSTAKWHD